MKGSYSYVGTDGLPYVVDWFADETGFHPSAPHLPQSVLPNHPEVAEAVEVGAGSTTTGRSTRRSDFLLSVLFCTL